MSASKQQKEIIKAAQKWRESEYAPRQEAIDETLRAPNRWTGPSLNHTLDRWMQQLTEEALSRWLGRKKGGTDGPTVAVLHGEEGPLEGLRAAVAVWALGYSYVGVVPESSPALLPGFASEVRGDGAPAIEFAGVDEAFARADAVIADESAEVQSVSASCDQYDIPDEQRLLRSSVYSVGIVDGHETEDEMERLAEDMLLYEGKGRRRLAVLWAPQNHAPDPYLEAMARFRGLFPAHEDTPGSLQMQQAFLEARDESHAYADGLEFLVSRGDPEPQKAGHVRWTEYEQIDDVHRWWTDHEDEVYAVIARRHLHDRCPSDWPLRTPGGVHTPPLDDADGQQTATFLKNLVD
jgi:hypothetical protein